MKCKKCGNKILDEDKVCNQCGEDVQKSKHIILEYTCYNCGEIIKESDRECSRCGVIFEVEEIEIEEQEIQNKTSRAVKAMRTIAVLFLLFVGIAIGIGYTFKGNQINNTIRYIQDTLSDEEVISEQEEHTINILIRNLSYNESGTKKINKTILKATKNRYNDYCKSIIPYTSIYAYLNSFQNIHITNETKNVIKEQMNAVSIIENNRLLYLKAQGSYDNNQYDKALKYIRQITDIQTADKTYKNGQLLEEKCLTDDVFQYYYKQAENYYDKGNLKKAYQVLQTSMKVFGEGFDVQYDEYYAYSLDAYTIGKVKTEYKILLTDIMSHKNQLNIETDISNINIGSLSKQIMKSRYFALCNINQDNQPILIVGNAKNISDDENIVPSFYMFSYPEGGFKTCNLIYHGGGAQAKLVTMPKYSSKAKAIVYEGSNDNAKMLYQVTYGKSSSNENKFQLDFHILKEKNGKCFLNDEDITKNEYKQYEKQYTDHLIDIQFYEINDENVQKKLGKQE